MKISNSKRGIQSHSGALAMVPFDRAYTFPINVPLHVSILHREQDIHLFPKT